MPRVEGLRSPYDKTLAGLHHLGRMLDKIRLRQASRLPPDFHRNYGLSVGLDGQLCGFLNVPFEEIVARVQAGGTDEEWAAFEQRFLAGDEAAYQAAVSAFAEESK